VLYFKPVIGFKYLARLSILRRVWCL